MNANKYAQIDRLLGSEQAGRKQARQTDMYMQTGFHMIAL